MSDEEEYLEIKAQLLGSFTLFCKTFFPLVTGRDFFIPSPEGREPHVRVIARELVKVFRGDTTRLIINVPPGHFKSTLVSIWVAWTLARYPDSQYIYISYSKELAAKHTEFIKRIINTPHYQQMFNVSLMKDSRAKDSFKTTQGGSIKAFGSTGAITGQDAGLPNLDRFSGAVILDDMHKPDEVHSDTVREKVISNYKETILQRPRGPNVPIIFIGQRLHEADLPAYLAAGEDVAEWDECILKAVDEAGNVLYPEFNSKEYLQEQEKKNPYVYASQFQQDPIPAGGALFKPQDFRILPEEPEILCTFITADTAETSKDYNDATAFGFWGLYKVKHLDTETGMYGLHCIDVMETRVEPRDLENTFMSFYGDCLLHKVKPMFAAIEKKSTGVTLISVLEGLQGLKVIEVNRTKASGSKTQRFLEMQPLLKSGLVTFTEGAKHYRLCTEHMMKITANDSHRHDDIADNFYDAVKLGLIDKHPWLHTHQRADVSSLKTRRLAQKLSGQMEAKRDSWSERKW